MSCELPFHPSHPIGVEQASRRSAIEKRDGFTKVGLTLFSVRGLADPLDDRADLTALSSVP